jgi:hypothetical protein
MPNWVLLLFVVFVALGLRKRPTWNVNAIAVGVVTVVLVGTAVREHLIPV